jgi:hypothetical protein
MQTTRAIKATRHMRIRVSSSVTRFSASLPRGLKQDGVACDCYLKTRDLQHKTYICSENRTVPRVGGHQVGCNSFLTLMLKAVWTTSELWRIDVVGKPSDPHDLF